MIFYFCKIFNVFLCTFFLTLTLVSIVFLYIIFIFMIFLVQTTLNYDDTFFQIRMILTKKLLYSIKMFSCFILWVISICICKNCILYLICLCYASFFISYFCHILLGEKHIYNILIFSREINETHLVWISLQFSSSNTIQYFLSFYIWQRTSVGVKTIFQKVDQL